MKKQRKWKPYSGRILSSLLALCLLIGMLPTAALAAEDEPQDGGAPIVCTELEGCTEDTHDESCPLYVKPSAPLRRSRRSPARGPLLRSGFRS